jgi:hypothetical protein
LALTPDFAKLSISPESSDGFASVGTILPKEEVALLPGGLFVFPQGESARGSRIVCPKMRRFPRNKMRLSADEKSVEAWNPKRAPKLFDEKGSPIFSRSHFDVVHVPAHDLIGVVCVVPVAQCS